MQLSSLDGVETLSSLKYLSLLYLPTIDMEPLLHLPSLQTLTLSEDLREAIQAVETEAAFEIIYQ